MSNYYTCRCGNELKSSGVGQRFTPVLKTEVRTCLSCENQVICKTQVWDSQRASERPIPGPQRAVRAKSQSKHPDLPLFKFKRSESK